jgi:hypothetical protein
VYHSGFTAVISATSMTNAFNVMSNELSTPKILICTSDSRVTTVPTTFSTLVANFSYFVCGDAADAYPQMILTGDRNMGTLAAASSSAPAGAVMTQSTGDALWPGNSPAGSALKTAWTATDLHQKNGNLGMADGSAQQVSINNLQTALLNATNGPTATPSYNFPQ